MSAKKIPRLVWIIGAIVAGLVSCLLCICVVPQIIGTAFLVWDHHEYKDDLPTVPKYAPKAPAKVDEGKKTDKEMDKKKEE